MMMPVAMPPENVDTDADKLMPMTVETETSLQCEHQ